MNTDNIVTGTWLPVFPGFYNTLFNGEIMYEQEIDYINELVQPEALAKVMIDNLYNSKAGKQLWKDYEESIAKQCMGVIEYSLKELGFIDSIKFEEISSPKYYNFSNDSINIEVTFTPANLQAIRHFISEHFAEWKEYLKETYTSCDGFISHHSNVPGDEEWFADNAVRDSHNAGALLDFLCGENGIDSETLYYGCENQAGIDIEALEKECLKRGWYVPDTWWNRLKARVANLPKFKRRCANQYVCDTKKYRYVFAITRADVTNKHFAVYRLFRIFVFGRIERDEKNKK